MGCRNLKRRRRTGYFSLSVLEKDAGYARGGLLILGTQCSIPQAVVKDTKTPTAEMIFLDASSRVAETGSGKVSEGVCLKRDFDADVEQLTVFPLCNLRPSWP